MKSITLHQPWAHLVAIGAKQIETRSWPTKHRGLLAIHAGMDMTASEPLVIDSNAKRPKFYEPFNRYLKPSWDSLFSDLAYGGLVAIVRLTGCFPAEHASNRLCDLMRRGSREVRRWAEEQLYFGNYRPGRWAWALEPIVDITRSGIYARGYQGLWTLPPAIEFQVLTACAGAGCYLAPDPNRQLPERIAA